MATLAVHDLSKSFGGVRAVHDCSFDIAEAKITALIGPNGAGKTTLFNLVNGFQAPDSGRIVFRGHDVTKRAVWERSRLGMSRTFQLSRLFKNLSIRDNLLLAVRLGDDQISGIFGDGTIKEKEFEMIRDTLEFVGLKKSLNTPVTDLSYGEQKLFDLARALLNPHTFLLLDEPASGVNPVLREKLKTIMLQLKSGAAPLAGRASPHLMGRETVLLIEHDMDFVRSVADWVIVMVEGSVLAEGRPEEVVRDRRVLEAYLGTTREKS